MVGFPKLMSLSKVSFNIAVPGSKIRIRREILQVRISQLKNVSA
jgi:hypothetical protein